jgi:anti-sigma B factor antagonist
MTPSDLAALTPPAEAAATPQEAAAFEEAPAEAAASEEAPAEAAAPAESAALTVEGEMTVYRAVELKDAMLGALRRSGAVEVDLSRVTEIDSAGVQVLLLGKQLAAARHQELRLTATSPAVDEVLALLNLRGHLGLTSPAEVAGAPVSDAEATGS